MLAAAAMLLVGLGLCAMVLVARWAETRTWRRSVVAFHMRPPTGLSPDAVASWLGSLSALTHARRFLLPPPPFVIEISATAEGIAHYVLVAENMRGAVLASVRAHLSGARIEEAPDYLKNRPVFRVAAEWRLTNHHRPLAVDRVEATQRACWLHCSHFSPASRLSRNGLSQERERPPRRAKPRLQTLVCHGGKRTMYQLRQTIYEQPAKNNESRCS